MARFVSRHAKYRHIIRPQKASINFDGISVVTLPGLTASFGRDGRTDEDVQFGLTRFTFTGLPEFRGSEEEIPADYRISVFDTDWMIEHYGWSEEDAEEAIKVLRASEGHGVEFLEMVPEPTAIPWPTYNDLDSPEEIAQIALATGTVAQAIAYELENRNAAPVVNALEAVLNPEVTEKDEKVLIDAS